MNGVADTVAESISVDLLELLLEVAHIGVLDSVDSELVVQSFGNRALALLVVLTLRNSVTNANVSDGGILIGDRVDVEDDEVVELGVSELDEDREELEGEVAVDKSSVEVSEANDKVNVVLSGTLLRSDLETVLSVDGAPVGGTVDDGALLELVANETLTALSVDDITERVGDLITSTGALLSVEVDVVEGDLDGVVEDGVGDTSQVLSELVASGGVAGLLGVEEGVLVAGGGGDTDLEDGGGGHGVEDGGALGGGVDGADLDVADGEGEDVDEAVDDVDLGEGGEGGDGHVGEADLQLGNGLTHGNVGVVEAVGLRDEGDLRLADGLAVSGVGTEVAAGGGVGETDGDIFAHGLGGDAEAVGVDGVGVGAGAAGVLGTGGAVDELIVVLGINVEVGDLVDGGGLGEDEDSAKDESDESHLKKRSVNDEEGD